MMAGNITAIFIGALAAIFVSLITRSSMTTEEIEAEWEKTRDIDNPLNPWVHVYKGELKLEEGANFADRPPLDIVIRKFRAAKLTAYVAGLLFTILFVCIWPGSMLSIDVMDIYGFLVWTTLSRGWAFIAATFIILVPLIQEIHAIWRQHNINLKEEMKNNMTDTNNINNVNEGNGDLHSSTKAGGSKRGKYTIQLKTSKNGATFSAVPL